MYDIKTKQNLSISKNTVLNELKQKYKQIEEKLFIILNLKLDCLSFIADIFCKADNIPYWKNS